MAAPSPKPAPRDVLAVWRESRRLHRAHGESLAESRELWKRFLDAFHSEGFEAAREPLERSRMLSTRAQCEHELSEGTKWLAKAMAAAARRPTERGLKEVRHREMDLAVAYMLYEWARDAMRDGEQRRLLGCMHKIREMLLFYPEN